MATVSPGGLRAANVVRKSAGGKYSLSFDTRRLHRRLGNLFGESIPQPGIPGGHAPDLSSGPERACTSYLLGEFLSKFDDGKVNDLKSKTTWERFHEAEALCFETNQRLTCKGFGPRTLAIQRAIEICNRILGRFDWDRAAEGFGWGPGASTRLPRRHSDAAYKFSGNPETTIGNAALADAAIRSLPLWEQSLTLCEEGLGYCKIVPGNRIVTVPKNYKTDRTIAIEPDMNMYVQKGIGALMRERLRLAGCDLNDQSRNQRLARVGAISGRLATIDLSMASDTVSRVLVQKFIRRDWLDALEMCRSPFGVLPSGEKIFYQKFSSMGNGFTFELESLIFYSLALAWTEVHGEEVSRVSVYGDDIILPSTVAGSFCDLLDDVGFRANAKKSYWAGPFRESCGKHYFLEHDITPFYLRRPVVELTELFLLHNNLYRWFQRVESLLSEESRLGVNRLLAFLRSCAPAGWRKPRLPDGFGDGAFIGPFDQCVPRLSDSGWEFFEVNVLAARSELQYIDISGLLPKAMLSLRRRKDRLWGFIPKDGVPNEVHPVRMRAVGTRKVLIPQFSPWP